MTAGRPVREVIDYYIGGGWGTDAPSGSSTARAAVIRGTDFERVRLDLEPAIPYRYMKADHIDKRRLLPGDLIIEISGGSKDQPVGRTLLITEEILTRLADRAIPASFCKLIRPDQRVVDPRYFAQYMQLLWRDGSMREFQTQSTGLSNFHFESFLDRQIMPLPSLAAQGRIAEALGSFDELIVGCSLRARGLEQIARDLFRRWFVDFRYPGHDADSFVASDIGQRPTTWPLRRLVEMVDIDPTTAVPRVGAKPYVPMKALSETSMIISGFEHREGNAGAKFRSGDTLVARITPSLENGKTGYVRLPADEGVGFGSTEFIVLRSRSVSPEWVYLLARSDRFRDTAIKSMVGTSGRQRVRRDAIEQFVVAAPPADVMDAFSAHVRPMFELIQTLGSMIEALREIRDLSSRRILAGDVDPAQSPSPEVTPKA